MKTLQKQIIAFCILLTLTGVVFVSCKKDKDNNNTVPATEYGVVTGKVHSPNNVVIASAKIISGEYSTISNTQGEFSLSLPVGFHKLIIQTGSGHVFKSEVDVQVNAHETISLDNAQSELKQVKQIAFIPGAYDRIETIIIDTLGYTATAITVSSLDNLNFMQSFGGIFLNCGVNGNLDSLKYANLNNYVSGGGNLYASDWSVEFLTGDGFFRPSASSFFTNSASKNQTHEAAYSTMSTCTSPLNGGFLPDSALCTAKFGPVTMVQNAHILDPDIINVLGKDSMDIYYDLNAWEVISLVNAPFTTIIEDTQSGLGSLAVSCDLNGTIPAGHITYTTFHNHPQGNISQDVKLVLQHFILNM